MICNENVVFESLLQFNIIMQRVESSNKSRLVLRGCNRKLGLKSICTMVRAEAAVVGPQQIEIDIIGG